MLDSVLLSRIATPGFCRYYHSIIYARLRQVFRSRRSPCYHHRQIRNETVEQCVSFVTTVILGQCICVCSCGHSIGHQNAQIYSRCRNSFTISPLPASCSSSTALRSVEELRALIRARKTGRKYYFSRVTHRETCELDL